LIKIILRISRDESVEVAIGQGLKIAFNRNSEQVKNRLYSLRSKIPPTLCSGELQKLRIYPSGDIIMPVIYMRGFI